MESTENIIHVPIARDMSYFEKMRDLAGNAGSATVLSSGYLVAEDYPVVHFGALCRVALSLRLSEDFQTWWHEGFEPLVWVPKAAGLQKPSGPRILCPACVRETERVLREAHGAADCIQVASGDWETSTLYFGEEDEISRIREELMRMQTAE